MSLDTNYSFGFCLPLGSEHDAQANEDVFAVQDNPDPAVSLGYGRLPGTGISYALPVPCYRFVPHDSLNVRKYGATGIRNLHCLFDNGAVDFTYALNGAAHARDENELFNYYKIGNDSFCNPYTCWGSPFNVGYDSSGNNTSRAYVQFTFRPAAASTQAHNTSPPFHLVLQDNAAMNDDYGMYAANTPGNKVFCQMQVDNGTVMSGNVHYTFKYTYTDFWGHITQGANPDFSLTASNFMAGVNSQYKYVTLPLALPTDASNHILSGYFFLKGSLTSDADPAGALPNEDGTELGIYHVMNKQPYIYDIPLPGNQIVEPLNTYGVGGTNPGVSDPAGPRILGMRAVRIDSNLVSYTDGQGVVQGSRAETAPVSGLFNVLSTFSNSGYNANGTVSNNPVDNRDMVLIGSIAGRSPGKDAYGNDLPKVVIPGDVFNMVSFLTYVNPSTSSYAANPIKYWSLDNEPGNINLDRYVTDNLKPSVQNVQSAYSNATPVNKPVVMGPNLVRVEQNGTGTALSWWDTFFSTQYLVMDQNNVTTTHYAAELLDAISTHPYTGDDRSWEEHGVYESLLALQGKIRNAPYGSGLIPAGKPNAGRPKDLWITEHGWNWSNHTDMPRLQADYILRQYALGAAAGIPHEHNAYYYTESCGAAYDFYLWNRTPNRGGMAMRIFNEMTAGMHYDPQTYVTDTGKYVHVIPYTDGTNEILVAWGADFTDRQLLPDGHQIYPVIHPTDPPNPVSITLSTDTLITDAPLQIFDVMGNNLGILPDAGVSPQRYTIPVTGSPVYIKGLNGRSFSIANQWPTLRDETNYALAANGATASSSPCQPAGVINFDYAPYYFHDAPYNSGGVGAINDGVWQYDDGRSPDKTLWMSQATYTYDQDRPTSAGDYAAVTFAQPKMIDTLVAVVPSSNNIGRGTLCGVRDYEFQVSTDGISWTPVKTVKGNRTEWVLYTHFPAQTIKAARIVITNINNGRWYDDFTAYTQDNGTGSQVLRPASGSPARAMLYELEAYGPAGQTP